jgi:hypothetical protein
MAGDPILFINLFINFQSAAESIGNVSRLEIYVSLVHLNRAVTARLHGNVYWDTLPAHSVSAVFLRL